MIETTGFLVIRPERRGFDGKVTGIEIDRFVKTKPKLGVRDVAIKVVLRVDDRLFVSPEPEVVIELNDRRAIVAPELEVAVSTGDDEPTP